MTLDRAVRRMVTPISLSPFVALLALAALLFAVFAIHSEVSGHVTHTPDPTSSIVSGPEHTVAGIAAVVAAPVVAAVSSGGIHGMLDCALLAMTCALLLTLVSMVFLTRLPAMYRRLLEAGGVTLRAWRTCVLAIHRPNLILLSISRV